MAVMYYIQNKGKGLGRYLCLFIYFLILFASCNWYVGTVVLFYMKCLESGVGGGGVHS